MNAKTVSKGKVSQILMPKEATYTLACFLSQWIQSTTKNDHNVISMCWEPFPPSHCSASSFRFAVNMGHVIASIVNVDPRYIPGMS